MFCEVIATTNSGMPMLMVAASEKLGVVHTGCHFQVEAAEVQQAQRAGQRGAHQQRGQHAVARRQALDQQVAEEHPQHQHGAVLGGDEDLAADLEQDARQQAEASDAGMRLTRRSKLPVSPQISTSTAQVM
jgi:hypothetical protein